ncbi:hypothetical protein BKA70DRAFT_1123265 [Coprinopsis sp. MPI-PUGE-AT-0042]|nr:hypothetical protein BKA70DRAFT_1123265 [Coprinopsis sp. MPI-PUGE-AT-0042]
MYWKNAPLDIKCRIVAHLYLHDLQRLGGSDHSNRELCQRELHYRIASTLSRFGLDPATFLIYLKRWDAVVGGSTAVAIFTAGEVLPRDLNVYVPYGNLDDFANDMTSKPKSGPPSWAAVSTTNPPPRSLVRGTKQTIDLIHISTGMIITVSESLSREATIPVMLSPSTVTMNYFSHSTFICTYPQLLSRSLAIGNSLRSMQATQIRSGPRSTSSPVFA